MTEVPKEVLQSFYNELVANLPVTVKSGQFGDQRRCIVVALDPVREFDGYEVVWKVKDRLNSL